MGRFDGKCVLVTGAASGRHEHTLRRFELADEIASVAAFLLSPVAGLASGRAIAMGGG